jgi:hypothetical protein
MLISPGARCVLRGRRCDRLCSLSLPQEFRHERSVAKPKRSIPEIFTDLLSQFTTLLRKESQLARAEMSEKMSKVAMAQTGRVKFLVIRGRKKTYSRTDSISWS